MEISFSHSSRGDVNGPQRAGTVLMVYSGELEHCKDICRSEMRLIDREVCEDRKNVHSACQWVELSVLHLATVFVEQTRQDFFVSWKGKKKARRVILGQQHCLERVVFCGFVPRYPHVYTYCTQSPVWLVAAATVPAVCSRALQNRTYSGFSSGILQAHA